MSSALKESNLHFLMNSFLSSTNFQSDSTKDLQYDCFWRLSDWNQAKAGERRSSEDNGSFEFYHYEALKSFHENDNMSLKNALDQAHFSIIKDLRNISLGMIV